MAIIRINKLFGQFTNEIDLSQRCTIIIGENGLGKSTLLKVLGSLMNYDYIDLCRYYFESIEIVDNASTVRIEYCDLFPSPNELIAEIKDDEYGLKKSVSNQIQNLVKKSGAEGYSRFLACVFFEQPIPKILARHVQSHTQYGPPGFVTNAHDEIKAALNKLAIKVGRADGSGEWRDDFFETIRTPTHHIKYFSKSEYAQSSYFQELRENVKQSYSSQYRWDEWYYYDMVGRYQFEEEKITESHVIDSGVIWLDSHDKLRSELNLKRFIHNPQRIGPCSVYLDHGTEMAKSIYGKCAFEIVKAKPQKQMKLMQENSVIPINTAIRDNFFTDEYIKETNEKAVNTYIDLIGEEKRISSKDYSQFYASIGKDILNYLLPILLKGSLLSDVLGRVLDEEYVAYRGNTYDQVDDAFYAFWENLHIKEANRSEKILLFKRLIEKYLVNKDIDIFPSGIEITWKRTTESNHKSGFRVIESQSASIPLNSLSSGEKKIIILLFVAVFFENSTLMIDEPELSLSIIWQQSLLPDILNETNIKRVIVATHSPFIAEDETLHQCILPLDFEDGDSVDEQK